MKIGLANPKSNSSAPRTSIQGAHVRVKLDTLAAVRKLSTVNQSRGLFLKSMLAPPLRNEK
ncbi:MAG: hypothetical protein J7J67_01205 [Thermoproteales archaeon]|nr:hypothetical protein [Thermoproteales archaeon]